MDPMWKGMADLVKGTVDLEANVSWHNLGMVRSALSPLLAEVMMQVVDVGSNEISGNHACCARRARIAVTGTLPKDQSASLLVQMAVNDNWLSGTIEPRSLNYNYLFSASNNSFSGTISRRFGFLTSLEYLLLADNFFSSSLPPELGRLTRLQALDVSKNALDGSNPNEFENLIELKVLSISENANLNWNLTQLIEWHSVTDLLMQRCGIVGTTPEFLPDSVITLILRSNFLSGTMSEDLISSAGSVQLLDLSNNDLSGSIPQTAALAGKMQNLLLNNMHLSSSLPAQDSRRTNSPLYDTLSTVLGHRMLLFIIDDHFVAAVTGPELL